MSHADILDIDRGHIFRKHRHKNNKKLLLFTRKTVKNWPLLRFLQAGCYGARSFIEGFHVTSLQQNLPSHAAHSGHVGSHKIWPNSLLLKLHKA